MMTQTAYKIMIGWWGLCFGIAVIHNMFNDWRIWYAVVLYALLFIGYAVFYQKRRIDGIYK